MLDFARHIVKVSTCLLHHITAIQNVIIFVWVTKDAKLLYSTSEILCWQSGEKLQQMGSRLHNKGECNISHCWYRSFLISRLQCPVPKYLSIQEYEVFVVRHLNTNSRFSFPASVLQVCCVRLSQPVCCSLQSPPQLYSLFTLRHHIQTCFHVLKKN